jgi:PIN domain nuclease of toxin-antitoxin system
VNLLLDTHAILWFAAGDDRLSETARRAIESPGTTNYVSMGSWWEVAIKCSLNRLRLDLPIEDFMAERINEGFRVLGLETQHLAHLTTLPFHHRDPFDRLIICQALAENMPICTGDSRFAAYGVQVVW